MRHGSRQLLWRHTARDENNRDYDTVAGTAKAVREHFHALAFV